MTGCINSTLHRTNTRTIAIVATITLVVTEGCASLGQLTGIVQPPRFEQARERYREIHDQLLAAEPQATAEREAELRIEAARRARLSPLYMDLTVSFSKSISVFHASLGENTRLAQQAGDVAEAAYWAGLLDEVDQMILRFHQRGPRDHAEPREIGGIEAAEAFGNVRGGSRR